MVCTSIRAICLAGVSVKLILLLLGSMQSPLALITCTWTLDAKLFFDNHFLKVCQALDHSSIEIDNVGARILVPQTITWEPPDTRVHAEIEDWVPATILAVDIVKDNDARFLMC